MSEFDNEVAIRARAYHIWEQAGRPGGRHEEHWRQAVEELRGGRPSSRPDPDGDGNSQPETSGNGVETANGWDYEE